MEEITLGEVHRTVLEIKDLLIGDGQPGILTRLANVEGRQKERDTIPHKTVISLAGLSSVVASVVAAIVAGVVAGIGGQKPQ